MAVKKRWQEPQFCAFRVALSAQKGRVVTTILSWELLPWARLHIKGARWQKCIQIGCCCFVFYAVWGFRILILKEFFFLSKKWWASISVHWHVYSSRSKDAMGIADFSATSMKSFHRMWILSAFAALPRCVSGYQSKQRGTARFS